MMNKSAMKLAKLFAPSKRFIFTSNKLFFHDNDGPNESEKLQSTFSEPPSKREKCVNEVTLIGRIGIKPQKLISAKGNAFARFRMATNTTVGLETFTEWHDIVAFGDDFSNHITDQINKGDRVYVKGRLNYFPIRDFSDSSSTNKAESVTNFKKARIILQQIIILKRKAEKQSFDDEI